MILKFEGFVLNSSDDDKLNCSPDYEENCVKQTNREAFQRLSQETMSKQEKSIEEMETTKNNFI